MKRASKHISMVLFVGLVGTIIARPGLAEPRAEIGTGSPEGITPSGRQTGSPQRKGFLYHHYVQADPAVAADPAATPIPSPPPPVPPPVAPAQPVGAQPAPPVEAQPVQDTSAGRGLLIAGIIIAAGGGLGGVGSGVTMGLMARKFDNDAESDRARGDIASANSKSDRAKTYRTGEYVSFAVGGAAFVAGGALIIWGIVRHASAGSESTPPSVAVVPLVGPSLGGAALSANF